MQFLLILAGVTFVVIGRVNLPRAEETRQLEELRDDKAAELSRVTYEIERTERKTEALDSDPHYRNVMIRRLLHRSVVKARVDPDVGMRLDDYLEVRDGRRQSTRARHSSDGLSGAVRIE